MNGSGINVTLDLRAHARRQPDAPALMTPQRTLSYAALDGLADRACTWLHAQGVRAGDVVALALGDTVATAAALLGVMRLGAAALPMKPGPLAAPQYEQLREAGAGLLLLPPGAAQQAQQAQAVRTLAFDVDALGTAAPEPDLLCERPSVPAYILVGSGTTGRPRLMPLSHATSLARSLLLERVYPLAATDRLLMLSALHLGTPLSRGLAVWRLGACIAVWDQQADLVEWIARLRPNAMHIAVIHAQQLLERWARRPDVDLSGIRATFIGASRVADDLRLRLRRDLKANLHINYGSNEACTLSFARPGDVDTVPGTVGRPPPGVTLEIVDAQDRPLAPGAVGQVRVRSSAAIAGYLGEGDAGRFSNGWFYPGDLARWDADGQLIHCGRADEMMICNGINVYPAEIERTMAAHPAVQDVAALPLPHGVAQEVPACAVVLRAGQQVTPAQLLAYGRQLLGFSAPCAVALLAELPRNERGKVVRADLLTQVTQQLRQQAVQAATARQRRAPPGLSATFECPSEPDGARLAAWCAPLWTGDAPVALQALAGSAPGASGANERARAWLGCALALAVELAQSAQCPVFTAPRVRALTRADTAATRWRAELALPALAPLPPAAASRLLAAALDALAWMHAHEPTAQARALLYRQLEEQGRRPLRPHALAGKSSLHVLRAARQAGVPVTPLAAGIYQLGWGARARRIERSTTGRDSAMGMRLAGSKTATAQLLRAAGLPAPEHVVVGTLEAARGAVQRLGTPVVVKPADGERGEGVTVDVDEAGLETAFRGAMACSARKQVLVERQVAGTCHRLFIASGRLLYAVKRLPMGVYGDGVHTVAELVARGHAAQLVLPAWRRSGLQPLDDAARQALAAAGLTPDSVPAAGRFAPLRRIESTAWGGVDEEVTHTLHPDNLRIALDAAALLGLEVAGVDLISPDIARPWHANGAVLNEVNYAPLLGGGEISRRHLPAYLRGLLGGDGRIPVEVYVGDEAAWQAAGHRRALLAAQGCRAALSSAQQTLGPDGRPRMLAVRGLHARARALLLAPDVEALLLVVQDDELLATGLPLDRVDALQVVNVQIQLRPGAGAARRQALLGLLRRWAGAAAEPGF